MVVAGKPSSTLKRFTEEKNAASALKKQMQRSTESKNEKLFKRVGTQIPG